MQSWLQNTRAVCNPNASLIAMEVQTVPTLEAAEVADPGSKRRRCESPLAIAPQPVEPLEAADMAGEWLLTVHPRDTQSTIKDKFVPLRHYAATNKSCIGLRKDAEAADDRAMTLFNEDGTMDRSTLDLLRIQFSHKGFSYYATRNL